jgi:hypothetical protein
MRRINDTGKYVVRELIQELLYMEGIVHEISDKPE